LLQIFSLNIAINSLFLLQKASNILQEIIGFFGFICPHSKRLALSYMTSYFWSSGSTKLMPSLFSKSYFVEEEDTNAQRIPCIKLIIEDLK